MREITDKIYTRDEAVLLVEMFDDVLCKYGIEIPSPEDDERDPECPVGLYGSTYSDLLDGVENGLIKILKSHHANTEIVEGIFSGTI